MGNTVGFEAKVKILGSPEKVEKMLKVLAEQDIILEAIDEDRIFPDPVFPGPLLRENIAALIQTKRFEETQLKAQRLQAFPDNDIRGGRRYCHVHVDDLVYPLSESAFGQLIIDAERALSEIQLPNEIPLRKRHR
jgi:hypothetical protein